MHLSVDQLNFFDMNGFLLIENVFSQEEMDLIFAEMQEVISEECERRILERNGSVRSFFAPHFSSTVFDMLSRDERVVLPSAELLGGDIYLYQSKLNTKAAMLGDWWEWHQDYTYWRQDDGMLEPHVLTAMIFLNDVTEFNGPLFIIPGSHKTGMVDSDPNDVSVDDAAYRSYLESAGYLTSLTADLKYKLKHETICNWATKKGIFSAKGPRGSLLFFHGNVFHASSNNLSPWNRHAYLLTYNRVDNKLAESECRRPEFLANRNAEPIRPATFSIDQLSLKQLHR